MLDQLANFSISPRGLYTFLKLVFTNFCPYANGMLILLVRQVVPMSRLSGVLEWCEGTIPMGLYLAAPDNAGAHARYRPQVRYTHSIVFKIHLLL